MRRKKLMTAAIAAFCLMTSAAVPAGISMAAEETETETAARRHLRMNPKQQHRKTAQKREQKQIQKQRRRQRRFPNGRTTMPLTMLHWENIQDLR